MKRFLTFLIVLLATSTSIAQASSDQPQDIYFSGISFIGDYKDNNINYPYSYKIAKKYPLDQFFVKKVRSIKNPSLTLTTRLSDSDDAIGLSLAIDLENISIAQIDTYQYKAIIDIYSQILLFDFGEKKIINSYPVNVQYIGLFNKKPSENEINALIEGIYVGNNPNIKTNIFDLAVEKINTIKVKSSYGHRLKVDQVNIEGAAKNILKELNIPEDTFKTLTAQSLTKSLNDNQKVAVLPYTKGQAIGSKMTARFVNGDIYNLEIPESDYHINLTIRDFKTLNEVNNNTKLQSFFVYTNIQLIQPDLNKVYMNMNFRGQESAILLKKQQADLKNSYTETLMNLFDKFTKNISKTDSKWLDSSVAPNLHSQAKKELKSFLEVANKCK